MSVARRNLKEDVSKPLVCRTEIAYKAGLREISWPKAAKSDNYHLSELGIRLSGKRLGRPKKDADTKSERKTAYQDNTDRIEVERKFSLAKRKFDLGLLLTKREDTTKASIALSVIAMNTDRLAAMLLRLLKFTLSFLIFDYRK